MQNLHTSLTTWKTEQEKYGPMIEEVGKKPTDIKLTEEWMEYLDIEEKEKFTPSSLYSYFRQNLYRIHRV